jgi:isopentenyl-diphosphate Delta-isomerase
MRENEKKNLNTSRKEEHLQSCLSKDVGFKTVSSGFENYSFIHNALPEVSLDEIDVSTVFLGKKLNMPFMISPMTGGTENAAVVNQRLAEAAQFCQIAMGVGSQRVAIEHARMEETFTVRNIAPDILLFANLGAVQLNYGFHLDDCRRAIEMIGADGLMLHLNPMQEAFQPEGNHDFSDLLKKINSIAANLKRPLLIREVGFGISKDVACRLKNLKIAAIDVGGSGGTSWIEIERDRLSDESLINISKDFLDWGIPTAESIKVVKKFCPIIPVIASGGIRSGLDVAKSIALGADIAGIALPVLKIAQKSTQALIDYFHEIETGLKIAMFGIGAKSISKLKNAALLYKKKEGPY